MARKTKDTLNLPDDARKQLGGLQQATRRVHRHKDQFADYSTVDANILHVAVTAVTATGGAIQLGYTKDGSSYVIRLLGDGDPYNDYVRPTEDVNAYFEALAADYSKR